MSRGGEREGDKERDIDDKGRDTGDSEKTRKTGRRYRRQVKGPKDRGRDNKTRKKDFKYSQKMLKGCEQRTEIMHVSIKNKFVLINMEKTAKYTSSQSAKE